MSKAVLLTPKQLAAIQTVHENHLTVATPNSDEVLIGKLLSHIQALQKKIKATNNVDVKIKELWVVVDNHEARFAKLEYDNE